MVISTSGDRILDRPLKEVGGKGLFTKEIEQEMLDRKIDIAVHSMKDMPVEQPDGLTLALIHLVAPQAYLSSSEQLYQSFYRASLAQFP